MAISYQHFKQLLSQEECEQILLDLPKPDYETAPAIDRTKEQVPLDTWYKMEKVPIRIETVISNNIRTKLVKELKQNFTAVMNRMYITKYSENEYCVPHTDPAEHTVIIQLNDVYSGGIFTLNNIPIEMNTGDAVVFSNKDNLHGVRKIKSGVRYALALWVNFDK